VPPLSIILWLPLACAMLGSALSLLGRRAGVVEAAVPAGETSKRGVRLSASGAIAIVGALGALGLAIGYIADYSPSSHGLTHVTDVVWIAELGIHYKLGVDGLNVFMVGLTTLLFAAAVIAANLREWERPRLFYFNLMLAESAVFGALLV
jgi:NADH:ubiquinone oxidoreductase subunit 4 (subunit M)